MLRRSDDSSSDSDDDSASETSTTEPVAAPRPARSSELNPLVYIAPKPARPWASIILKRVLFPPILILDAVQLGVNYFFGEKISKEILPAQSSNLDIYYNKIDNRYIETTKLAAKIITVVTHDGARLATLQISDTNGVEKKEQNYIIHFLGNGQSYQDINDEMEEDAKNLKCNVIGFNLRGVGNSTGKPRSINDLVTDGIAQVQRLIDEGVDPEKIVLKGFSLGGGIATLVAKHFHDNGSKINLFNRHSFSSVTNVVVGWIRSGGILKSGHVEPLGWKVLGWLAKPFIKLGLVLSKWEIDAESAYRSLPDTHKEYMLVRSSRADRRRYGREIKDDPVITHYASIHAALKDERIAYKTSLKEIMLATRRVRIPALIHKKVQKAYDKFQEAKQRLNERKMYLPGENRSSDGHNASMNLLIDRYKGNNANNFFNKFVKRANDHHDRAKRLEVTYRVRH